MDRVIFVDPVVEAFGQQAELKSVGAFDETTHPMLPRRSGKTLPDSSLFTQPGVVKSRPYFPAHLAAHGATSGSSALQHRERRGQLAKLQMQRWP
jgi:hypothetical protein